MSINFEQISKRYGDNAVVNDVSLQIATGEFFVLLGPSGSGKSTLLRAAAGLTDIDHGRIVFHGNDVTHVPARQRGVGLVFQHYALFRHMTVGENVEFALRVRGVKRAARARRRDELLQLVALEGFAGRMPGQLSGGQQQRVAVARALAHEPAVLLLDEPFGALDAQIRIELRDTIRQVQRRLGMTTILVTHDQEEAFALGDRIGVMHHGRLLECGKPEALYRHPATRFVASFLGSANLLLGELSAGGIRLGEARLNAGHSVRPVAGNSEVVTVVRPEDIELADRPEHLRSALLSPGHVESVSFAGGLQRVRVQLPGNSLLQSAVGDIAAGTPLIIDVTRTSSEQTQLPLVTGRRVAIGIRRLHVLPTPISSFRIVSDLPDQLAALRRAPLLAQLADSMRARIIEAGDAAGRDAGSTTPQLGVAVLASGTRAIASIVAAVARGTQRLLCIPASAGLPRRVVICTDSDAARPATLALVASVMRHLQAEVTFVSVQRPSAPRADVASSFQRLLDARAELLETHGLDIRTDVQIGEFDEWVATQALTDDNTLIVLGLDGNAAQIEAALTQRFQPLFAGRCPVLLSCSNASAASLASVAGAIANNDAPGLADVVPG
jgi:sulfate/thiosulfate transport system ATP-binding protein